jgi:hypothetical protein
VTEVIRARLPRVNGAKDPNDLERAGMLKDTLQAAIASATDDIPDRAAVPTEDCAASLDDLLNWTGDFTMTTAELAAIQSPTWAYQNLVIEGHFVVICARSGHGKTTILLRVSADMAAAGYHVVYVNADTAAADAKPMAECAAAHGYTMLLPDMKVGLSMKDVVERLRAMADKPGDLTGVVFIFDTLKKMVDVINKRDARDLYSLLRKLTARGVTCIAAAHTNKYNAADGSPIFEGTGDLRSDCDDLLYLVADKREDGTMLVSTIPDKERGSFKPITFEIDRERNVSRTGYVDVLTTTQLAKQYEDDRDVIERVIQWLQPGPQTQAALVERAKAHGINRKRLRRVLVAYGHAEASPQCWHTDRAMQNNALRYYLPVEERNQR